MLAATMVVAGQLDVHVGFRQHTLSVSPLSMAVLVAAMASSPARVLAALVLARCVRAVLQRGTPLKAVFNLLNPIVGAGAALATFRLALGSAQPDGLRGWAAIAAGCVVFDVVTVACIVAVVGLSGGALRRDRVTGALLTIATAAPANAVVAVVAAGTIAATAWGLLPIGVVAVGLVAVLRRQRKLREKYDNLDTLYGFTQSLAGLTEAGEVLAAVLGGIEDLLGCREAELLVVREGTRLRSWLLPNGELAHDGEPTLDAIEADVLRTGAPRLITRGQRDRDLVEAITQRGWRDALAAPFTGSSGIEGVLIAGERLGTTSSFSEADVRLLQALAAHSSVALRGTELLGRLRDEVAARSHEALHDALTGLANRNLMSHRLNAALAERGRDGVAGDLVGVLMVDLDNFKEINDTLGHHTGDEVLREAATRLVTALGRDGTVARIGGDEFAVVLPGCGDEQEVADIAERLLGVMSTPVTSDAMSIAIQASLGIAIAPGDGEDADVLLRRADIAMYTAKTTGTGAERYDRTTDPNTTRRLRLTSDLRAAIADGEIDVWYQPKADLSTGKVIGVEALARWVHPIYGAVSPEEFIPLAEQSGSIGPLTWWVLATSLRQLRLWDRLVGEPISMSVNLSARSLIGLDLVQRLRLATEAADIAPERLIIELTESSIMADPDRAERTLAGIADLGVRIALDDFGTGYSSLSRLNRLAVSEIKIDKSFVSGMCTANTEAIVVATIELGASLGLYVTAEGVEDQATWDRLRTLGCGAIQGYHLARPMPARAATRWLIGLKEGQPGVAVPA